MRLEPAKFEQHRTQSGTRVDLLPDEGGAALPITGATRDLTYGSRSCLHQIPGSGGLTLRGW